MVLLNLIWMVILKQVTYLNYYYLVMRMSQHTYKIKKKYLSKPYFSKNLGYFSKPYFLELTKSILRFPTESASKIGHPAPFPVELARRCIQLYTYSNEIVLDPFMGSGTTAVASVLSNRQYLGYETSQEYVDLSLNRLSKL